MWTEFPSICVSLIGTLSDEKKHRYWRANSFSNVKWHDERKNYNVMSTLNKNCFYYISISYIFQKELK